MKHPSWVPHLFVAVHALFLVFMLPRPASANFGSPQGGQVSAEPTGIKEVDITHETLTIDARPLSKGQMVYVEAVYQLDNRGSEKQLHLLFASGSERVSDFQVWLGEQKVPTTPAEGVEVPASWKPPPKTPGIHGGYYLDYGHVAKRPLTPLACTIVLPPGQQSLKVRYQAEASKYPSDLAAYWQFAYVLAPARDWAWFGGLDVTIHLPDGWYAAATPPLTREGEVLHGSFADIPADAIALDISSSR